MDREENHKSSRRTDGSLEYGLMALMLLVCIAILYVTCKRQSFSNIKILKIFCLNLFFVGGVLAFGKLQSQTWTEKRAMFLCVLLSYLPLLEIPYFNKGTCWMLGGWLLGVIIHPIAGSFYQAGFCLLHAILTQQTMEQMTLAFFLSVGMCQLIPSLRRVSDMGYVVLIGLLGNAVSIVMENDLYWNKILTWENLWWESGMFLTLVLAAVLVWRMKKPDETATDCQRDVSEVNQTKAGESLTVSLQSLVKIDAPFLMQLKKQQEKTYFHSVEVARLAAMAAKEIHADQLLCMAGGLYHEIGRIEGADYVIAGTQLSEREKFPEGLTKILQEHNVKYKLASSREAAIVMLADSCLSVLENSKEANMPDRRKETVKRVFSFRLEQGSLDCSGISLTEYRKLEQSFVNWIEKENTKETE